MQYEDTEIEKARKLFSGECKFIAASLKVNTIPMEECNEIAFAGRSNVGKSSLVNALTNRKTLARTSQTPGRTRQLIFFEHVHHLTKLRLVDLPGYGFAKAPLKVKEKWEILVRDYFFQSQNLRRVFLLIDSRHGIKANDIKLMEILGEAGVTFQVVFTKFDKVKQACFNEIFRKSIGKLASYANAYPEVLVTSSKKKHGIAILRANICQLFLRQ